MNETRLSPSTPFTFLSRDVFAAEKDREAAKGTRMHDKRSRLRSSKNLVRKWLENELRFLSPVWCCRCTWDVRSDLAGHRFADCAPGHRKPASRRGTEPGNRPPGQPEGGNGLVCFPLVTLLLVHDSQMIGLGISTLAAPDDLDVITTSGQVLSPDMLIEVAELPRISHCLQSFIS